MPSKQRYSWYRDDEWINEMGQNLVILKADMHHGGNYQCQVNAGGRSDPVQLDVSEGEFVNSVFNLILGICVITLVYPFIYCSEEIV
ncbi:hypothetical protein XENTR_v10022661 [Xenopus tropicalis]|nr:hypothetical protein XENTR_v10022661 [Xenopus tropicalis]